MTANALKMLKLFLDNGVLTSVIKEKAGDEDVSGVYLAIPLLNRLLPEICGNQEIMYEVRAHILSCIYSHEFEVKDLTEEACFIGIADGTDMTKGRGRMAFDKGNVNIHTVSALSIEKVEITRGKDVPVQILIHMSNSAGIFQIQETLGKKIMDSSLEDYVEVIAVAKSDEPVTCQRKKVSSIRLSVN